MKSRDYLVITVVFVLISCGGDSDELVGLGDNSSVEIATDGNQVSSASELMNPLVEGSIYYGGESSASNTYLMDLRTGNIATFPNSTNWDEFYDGSEFIYSEPIRHGEGGAVLTILSCGDIFDVNTSCIVVVDSQGRLMHAFSVGFDVYGSAKLSHDKQYIAMVIEDAENDNYLYIHTVDGERVSSRQIGGNYPFHWLADGRLLIEEPTIFVLTEPHSTIAAVDISFNNDNDGWIASSDISPDSSKVAYIAARSVAEGVLTELRMLELETLRIKPVLGTPNADIGNTLATPSWSPDGNWILVNLGTRNSGAIGTPLGNIPNSYYAVRADHSERLTVDSYIDDTESPLGPLLVRLKNSIGIGHSYFWQRGERYHWVDSSSIQ